MTCYTVKRAFLVGLVLDTILIAGLVVFSLVKRTFGAEPVILVIILIPFVFILAASLRRRVYISREGCRVLSLFRTVDLHWDAITNLDALAVGKKEYLLLTTTKGYHVLQNSLGHFVSLAEDLIDGVADDRIERAVFSVVENPLRRVSDVMSVWIAAVILIAIYGIKISV